MKLAINNRQTRHRLDRRAVRALLGRLAGLACRHAPALKWSEITLFLLDDEQITEANLAVFGRECPTDVITQAYAPDPATPGELTGEILVNAQRAWEEGTRRGDPDRELALYMAHGCLHLTGADDATPAERAAMGRIQNRWLRLARPGVQALFSRADDATNADMPE